MNKERNETVPGSALPARRDYKDTIFRRLFQDRENLLSLYNAVNRTSYTDAEALTVVTLENAVYMNMKNNGTEEREESSVLKLSDSFEYVGTQKEEPNLELKVLVLNINQGKNKELLELCRTLREYMIFVDRIRLYTKTMELDAAAERAVDECIHEGVLSDFLRKNRGEAIEMSIFEYDEEREIKLIRKAEYEEGRIATLKNLISKKIAKGWPYERIAEDLELECSEVEKLVKEIINSQK